MNKRILVLLMSSLMLFANGVQAADSPVNSQTGETREQRDARMKWWREARFGLFIHWGLYAVPAGTYEGRQVGGIGEWIMHNAHIPLDRYAKYAESFNPVKFNAEEWVRIAKNAGMKYIVITSKHHDGFAMFKSAASPYNIYDATPFKRDPLKELAAACKKEGIKLGFYYSQAQDWHHAGGAAMGGHWDKAQDGDMTAYLRNIAVPQVKEILSNYGDVAVLWWDTPCNMSKERADLLLPLLKLQPNIIWNNRLGGGYQGDTETPEQFIPATGYPGRDWETCMTMNDTWGFKSYDNNWKPVEGLIRNLSDIASKGGNYLLNVGPTDEGLIPTQSVERLAEVGKWMKVNGESIYATQATPFKRLPWGRCTRKEGLLYLHVFDWPKDGKLVVPGLASTIRKAYLLADSKQHKLAIAQDETGTVITVGDKAPDPVVSVVVLKLKGPLDIRTAPISQATDGSVTLPAKSAAITGSAQLEGPENNENIGFWTSPDSTVAWTGKITKPGKFTVEVTSSCAGTGGSEYTLSAGKAAIKDTVAGTGGWGTYTTRQIGTLTIADAGTVEITIKPSSKVGEGIMNLRTITLKPAP